LHAVDTIAIAVTELSVNDFSQSDSFLVLRNGNAVIGVFSFKEIPEFVGGHENVGGSSSYGRKKGEKEGASQSPYIVQIGMESLERGA